MKLGYSNKNYASVMYIPSLTEHGVYLTIANATHEEAEEFAAAFTEKVEGARKTASAKNAVSESIDFVTVGGLDDLMEEEDGRIEALIEKLSVSDLPGQRGLRIVYIDIDAGEIGVGTTVVYNQNRAMTGVSDSTIAATIFAALA